MRFRLALNTDFAAIMRIVAQAQAALRGMGVDQWQDGYPDRGIIIEDLARGRAYIAECDGAAAGFGVLIIGEEPTYKYVEGGEWGSDKPYATLHRLAVAQSDKRRGVASFLLDNFEGICLDKGINWLRADTHKDNLPMQGLLNKHGFKRVGVIYLENGAQRIAFEKRVA